MSEPYEVALQYLKLSFPIELISVLPFSILHPRLVILRFLKMPKLVSYQKYIDELVADLT